ncbi:hypothetical protein PMAYCL1PPCAC_06230, partial [Pristionchus mayeri]
YRQLTLYSSSLRLSSFTSARAISSLGRRRDGRKEGRANGTAMTDSSISMRSAPVFSSSPIRSFLSSFTFFSLFSVSFSAG